MVSNNRGQGWREERRRFARARIIEAAWALCREGGLAGLSMRDLATRVGITTPTVYAYFESKNDIYDAMFCEAATEFEACMAAPYDTCDQAAALWSGTERFVGFCTKDPTRYQLLFQRTVPGFEPSAESYAHAVKALEASRVLLAGVGVDSPKRVDLWTALMTGLVDQQVSNDPGGDRWVRLVDDAVAMFLSYCGAGAGSSNRATTTRPARSSLRR